MRLSLLFLLSAGLPLTGLMACKQSTPEYQEIKYPKMVLSETSLEFGDVKPGNTLDRGFTISNEGEMVMGVGDISIGVGMAENFAVTWDVNAIECPAGETTTATPGEGKGGTDTAGDTGGGTTTTTDTGTDSTDPVLFTLSPGCKIPVKVTYTPLDVGDIYGAINVESIQKEPTEAQQKANELPDYLRDPYRFHQQVYLHGETSKKQGIVVVRPRTVDFGYVNPGDVLGTTRQIGIANLGDGDITLGGTDVEAGCDVAYSVTYAPPVGRVLHGGETALVEVTYEPLDTNPAFCSLHILSDDLNNPDIDVTIKGNSGTDPENRPPTVSVRSPAPGTKFSGIGTLRVELNVFDVNQPASTLLCKIKSAVVQQVSVAACTPDDESGHVFVDIPADNLKTGIDTLLVSVVDAEETTAYASTSVVIGTTYPEGDDDGDGYDETTSPPDCDDSDRNTYPEAAEIYDGQDNNCNLLIDEHTIGYDDDGDAFSEMEEDCNDYNRQAYPGAPERADGVDNDCDGLVDEGTSLYDDDGDGYAEVNNDCDDGDPTVSPAGIEVCDGIDNDCDFLKDAADNCASTNSPPVVVGEVRPAQNACLSGERITLDLMVYEPDGQTLSWTWSDDSGNGTANFDNAQAASVNWTCPSVEEGGRKFNVYAISYDPDNNQVWSFAEVSVYPSDYNDLYEPYLKVIQPENSGTCSSVPGAVGGWMLMSGLAALVGRRRR